MIVSTQYGGGYLSTVITKKHKKYLWKICQEFFGYFSVIDDSGLPNE